MLLSLFVKVIDSEIRNIHLNNCQLYLEKPRELRDFCEIEDNLCLCLYTKLLLSGY